MKFILKLLVVFVCCWIFHSGNAQNRECATMLHHQYLLNKFPQLSNIRLQNEEAIQNKIQTLSVQKLSSVIITIPVVVHVVYNKTAQNISDAQIKSQIDVLNQDYRKLNADTSKIPQPWKSVAADVGVEFCLAKKDPAGNDTTGITRTYTTTTQFSYNDQVKQTSLGGEDAWDATKYLNLWVCNLGSSIYGFAQFPSDLSTSPSTDGVVINYDAFGTIGSVVTPGNAGRTATHEIGHWLDLYHNSGDDGSSCSGTDYCNDTPNQASYHFGCLTFPYTDACSSTYPGIMFMNYMDYGDDTCLIMFTHDQTTRMLNAITTFRPAILNTTLCSGPSAIVEEKINSFSIYPNPTNGLFKISSSAPIIELSIYDNIGQLVYQQSYYQNQSLPIEIDLINKNSGVYFVKAISDKGYSIQKIILAY